MIRKHYLYGCLCVCIFLISCKSESLQKGIIPGVFDVQAEFNQVKKLQGKIEKYRWTGEFLNEERSLHVYTPPNYSKDSSYGDVFGLLLKSNYSQNAVNYKDIGNKLKIIFELDQNLRLLVNDIEKDISISNARKSFMKDSLWRIILIQDSINLLTVSQVIDDFGWLSSGEIGSKASSALFLVIQHSGRLPTLEKFLGIVREAARQHKCSFQKLAILEDRIAVLKGQRQIYGSQLRMIDGKLHVLPIKDPDYVDDRRAEVGLPSMSEYLKIWNIEWDVEEHKRHTGQINYLRRGLFWFFAAFFLILLLMLKRRNRKMSRV